MSDEEFSQLVAEALDGLPQQFGEAMQNVAVVIADDPTPTQRRKLHLHDGALLFGLFEGAPKAAASIPYATIPPAKITVFKNPVLAAVGEDREALRRHVKHTVWHEVAHYFGLNHDDIRKLEAG